MNNFTLGLKRDEPDFRDYKMETKYNTSEIILPSEFNIRSKCPPVWNQSSENSCTAHSGSCARAVLENDNTLELSRAFLYFNERLLDGNTSVDEGSSMRTIMDATKKYGICLNSEMPYKVGDYKTSPTEQNYKNALQYKIKSYLRITTGIQGIKQWLYTKKQGVCFGMAVYDSMQSEEVAKTGILPMIKNGEKLNGYHAVYIVGWIDSKINLGAKILNKFTGNKTPSGYFVCRNSWGSQWGLDGYFLMPYEYVTQNIAFDFWVMENE